MKGNRNENKRKVLKFAILDWMQKKKKKANVDEWWKLCAHISV